MVDYSKWDAMEVSETESEGESEEEGKGAGFRGQASSGRGPAGVYKVTPGEDLHIPGRNVTLKASSGLAAAARVKPTDPEDAMLSGITEIPLSEDVAAAPDDLSAWAMDGALTDNYAWTQDADSVIVSVFLPAGAMARDVNVALLGGKTLRVTHEGALVLDGTLFAAVLPPPPEDEGALDWEIKDVPADPAARRAVRVTLEKEPVLGGAAIMWWKAALAGEPEIDISNLRGRSKRKQAAAASFMENFAKAKEMFAEKMRNREDTRVEVEID